MPRKLLAFLLLGAVCLTPTVPWACADEDATVSWKLKLTELGDGDNQPFLSPGNDSRVNLQLLLLDAGKVQLHPPGPAKDAADRYPDPLLAGPSPFAVVDITDLITPPPPPAPDANDSDRADGEGSRCDSNASGADQFTAALAASPGVSAADRTALVAARASLKPTCADDPKAPVAEPPPVQVRSADAKPFATYLVGASAFYDGHYDIAATSFTALRNTGQPWLKQTAHYMLGRVALNRAQAGSFDEFGNLQPNAVDAKALAEAQAAFEAYLHDYPNGTYATSARGLFRRIAWLGGKQADLAKEIEQALTSDRPGALNVTEVSLVQEADNKLLADKDAGAIREPLLLASYDLMHMRVSDDGSDKPIDRAALEAQKPVFAEQPALFDYLLAAHAFYDEKAPAAALALLPTSTPKAPMSYLDFSRQVLRGLVLEDTGDHAHARALWLALMPAARPPFQHATLELALAMNYERGGALAQVFAAGSPIVDPDIRELLLQNDAGQTLLRQQARSANAPVHERQVALFTLLYKEVTRGRYQAFVGDLALVPPPPPKPTSDDQPAPDPNFAPYRWDGHAADGYVCPTLPSLGSALAHDPHDPASVVCLDEFIRISGFDSSTLDTPAPKDELGGAPSQFPGGPYSRLESYKTLLADPKTPGPVRAYVLYRAVECYGPSGVNQCGGKDVPTTQRKAWFETLKSSYPTSPWAQRLKYYW